MQSTHKKNISPTNLSSKFAKILFIHCGYWNLITETELVRRKGPMALPNFWKPFFWYEKIIFLLHLAPNFFFENYHLCNRKLRFLNTPKNHPFLCIKKNEWLFLHVDPPILFYFSYTKKFFFGYVPV